MVIAREKVSFEWCNENVSSYKYILRIYESAI